MSLFITFEGGEGCGKSTQAKSLYGRLCRSDIAAVLTHEPGGTSFGEHIRDILKWTDAYVSPETELLMFNASRAQLLAEIIRPGLKAGKTVICDRYVDSTVAYQGYGRGLDTSRVSLINDVASGGLGPDLTVLLDMSPEDGFARIADRQKDRFEKEDAAFHERVREGFLTLARDDPKRWLVIDARQSKQKIGSIIWDKVSSLLDVKKQPGLRAKKDRPPRLFT